MFVFPLIMNALQYYIIDSFIKEPQNKEGGADVGNEGDADDESREPLREGDSLAEDYGVSHDSEEPKTPKSATTEVEPVKHRRSRGPSPANGGDPGVESSISSTISTADDRALMK